MSPETPEPKRSPFDTRIPPPILAAILAWGMWQLCAAPTPPWAGANAVQLGLSALLAALGLAFDVSGLLAFRAQRTTVNPLHPERTSALVTTGVYRITRNPMYVGMTLLLSAWAVLLGSALTGLGPVLFVGWIHRYQIAPEERLLEQCFGETFRAYARRVRRWL